MSLKSLLRKASIGLGSILLACNIGCNSMTSFQKDSKRPISLEDKVTKRPKLKKWQYPINIIGGCFTSISFHESAHAVVGLLHGAELKEYHPYPGFRNGSEDYSDLNGGWVYWEKGSTNHLSPQEKALKSIAGPVADITLVETINYNLKNGNISPKYQPFWATASLASRWNLLWVSTNAFTDKKLNDFKDFEKLSDISKETLSGLTFLYTALSHKRIKKELKVALGKDTYPTKTTNSRIDLLSNLNGLVVQYSKKF